MCRDGGRRDAERVYLFNVCYEKASESHRRSRAAPLGVSWTNASSGLRRPRHLFEFGAASNEDGLMRASGWVSDVEFRKMAGIGLSRVPRDAAFVRVGCTHGGRVGAVKSDNLGSGVWLPVG